MKRFVLLFALALIVAACGTSSDADVATLEESSDTTVGSDTDQQDLDAEQAILEFSQCMRDNGIPEFPDPELDENGNFRIFGGGRGGPGALGADQGTLQAAFEECASIIEDIVQRAFQNFDQSEFQDSFLEFAACMRDQGIDMADPDFSGGFGPGGGGDGGGGLFGDINPQDPAFQEAAEECQGIFEGGFGPGGGFRGGFGGGNGNGNG